MKKALMLCLTLLAPSSMSFANEATEVPTYSFGVVPQFSSERISRTWEPILELLEKETGLQFELTGSLDIPAFERNFTKGGFDFAYMNPYHAIVAHKSGGYDPIIRDVGRSLYGIIVVKKDSPLQSVTELDGKKVAFPAPNALGAALIPRVEFSRKYKIEVEEMYVGSHSSVYLNVALGLATAGGGVQKTFAQQPENISSQLRIISKTQEVPPHPITAHNRIPEKVKLAVQKALMKIAATELGAKLLKQVPIKVAGETNIEDYQLIKDMNLDEFYVK